MSRKGLLIAVVLVMVSNAYALARATANRAGAPEATLELTERELRLAPRETENTAMALQLAWIDPAANSQEPGWFDAAKLAEVGFDCRSPRTADNAEHYRTMPPRSAYAVFEYDGEAWQRYLAALPASADREVAARRSRLVLVDVGLDARVLRARHSDLRHTIIVPAVTGLAFVQSGTRPPFLRGRVNTVYPMELNVPRDLRMTLDRFSAQRLVFVDTPARPGLRDGSLATEPRYGVSVRWGRSLEPWIESVQATGQTTAR